MPGLKIRVLTGCQMDGLASALRIIFPTADVAGFHTYRLLREERDEILADVRTADIAFVLPLNDQHGAIAFDRIHTLGPKIQFVPQVVFAAFHPDIAYLEREDGSQVQTPMTDYNSLIAAAAYLEGLDAKRTIRLYNAYTYQALGYFSLLDGSKASLLTDFAYHSIDLRASLARWLEEPEPFMLSVNHPKRFVLADVAVEASRAAGLFDGRARPDFVGMPDHLARWVVYPVFKEIAARLGKTGSTDFKLVGDGEGPRLSLDAFVRRSFDAYAVEDIRAWMPNPRLSSARRIIAQLAQRSLTAGKTQVPTRDQPMTYAAPQSVKNIKDCYFYHTTDLPGHVTQKGGWDLRGRFADYIGGLDLKGRRVLDVGTASGFLSFSAEEAGAREVVSFDLDSADRQDLLPFADSEYVKDHRSWSAKQTAGFQRWKNAYWFTHALKRSKAKVVYGDVYALPETIGRFDVIILGAILEHLADPIKALASVARHADDYIVINTDFIDTDEPMARFNGRPNLPNASYIFWTYSLETYRNIMEIIGFEIVTVRRDTFAAFEANGDPKEIERVALVCRRRQAKQASMPIRKVA